MDRKRLITGAALAAQQVQEREQDIEGAGAVPTGSGEENGSPESEAPGETARAGGLAEPAKIDRAAETAAGAAPSETMQVGPEAVLGFVVHEGAGRDGAPHETVVDAANGRTPDQETEDG